MFKKTTFTISAFFLILLVLKPTAIAQSQAQQYIKIFVQLPPTQSDQAGLTEILTQHQGRIIHTFPSQALIALLPANSIGELKNHPDVTQIFTEAIPSETVESFDAGLRRWASVWNSLINPAAPDPATVQAFEEHPLEEQEHAFIAPDVPTDEIGDLSGAATVTPGYYQTSEYMAGSVAVGIVLVESDGSGDPSTEDWTEAEKQTVFNEIVTGLNWWVEMEPRANLSFVYDDHFSNPLPTSLEPISQSYTYQQYWIADAMSALGYTASSYFTKVRDYNNDLRDTY
ncbi:MAG: hypothetical protein R3264_18030, partial [Anaerolineae bacterium]|nr:hypothetical protein [Anaerolineae bacterium]